MNRGRVLAIVLVAVAASGCATHAMTSGRVVLDDGNRQVAVQISARDRSVIEDYYAGKKNLPPGLAKRAGGLPPGLAKRDKLPPGLRSDPLPADLERRLARLPTGYARVRIGGDVVLIDSRTRVVLDVVYGVAI